MPMQHSILNLNSRSGLKNLKEFIRVPISIFNAHQKFSGKKIQYFDPEINESYVPYVVETSIGLDRTFLAVLSYAYPGRKIRRRFGTCGAENSPVFAPIKAPFYHW